MSCVVTVAPSGVFQVEQRSRELEEAIQQAQTRESQIVEMSQWMTEVTSLLQNRLDADILAGDMPKEYEVGPLTARILKALIGSCGFLKAFVGFCRLL